ncbi:MAG: DUF169 domain-containing protein [Methanomassiliicoccales archaeon]|nr:DUF169 domain-containing protein [Methanomassiliicoccales archaeon]
MEIIGLQFEPVAVNLIKSGEQLPSGYNEPDKPVRHCQSIMRARKGEQLLIPSNKHACPVGGSALGILPTPEKVVSGEFHHNLKMYATQEAAAKTMAERPALKTGSIIATLVGPLSKAKMEPDVVIFSGTPEQMYWILPVATTFSMGGRITVETGSFQASCADSTVIPYMRGKVNISLGCYGCRKATDLRPEEMLVGVPGSRLEEMSKNIEKLGEEAITKCRTRAT